MSHGDAVDRAHVESDEGTPLQQYHVGRPLETRTSSSADEDGSTEKTKTMKREGPKRYYLGLALLLLYAFISIYSWAVVCILSNRPIGVPSWYEQAGKYGKSTYDNSDRVRQSSNVGLAAIAAIGIPLTSAIAARAAAVYCQRKSKTKAPSLSLRQMLALADKGWSGYDQIKDLLTPRIKIGTPLLIYSSFMVLIAFILPILQGVLVSSTRVRTLTLENLSNDTSVVGNTITPVVLSRVPRDLVINNIISQTQNGMFSDREPNLWSTNPGAFNVSSLAASFPGNGTPGYQEMGQYLFTTALPVGTDTGMLRNLALRLNMSMSCDVVPSSAYPQQCPGHNPLSKDFTNIEDGEDFSFLNVSTFKYRGRLCITGDIDASAWTSTSRRQEVSEEFWIDVEATNLRDEKEKVLYYTMEERGMTNFTQHCTCNSTLGYFELPNYWNGHTTGPLLDDIPPDDKNHTYYNRDGNLQKYSENWGHRYDVDNYSPFEQRAVAPGPLLMSGLAIFGNGTFFDAIASFGNNSKFSDFTMAYCRHLQKPFWGLAVANDLPTISPGQKAQFNKWALRGNMPYCDSMINADDGDDDYRKAVQANVATSEMFEWLANFADPDKVLAALTLTAYSVPKNMFAMSPNTTLGAIASGVGSEYTKPTMSTASMAVISVLVVLQLLGLTILTIYALHKPTWTEILDATAMLKIGFEVSKRGSVAELTASKAEMAGLLDQTEGWVGNTVNAEPGLPQSIRDPGTVLGGPEPVSAMGK